MFPTSRFRFSFSNLFLIYIDAAAIVEKESIHLHNFVEILDGLFDFLADKNCTSKSIDPFASALVSNISSFIAKETGTNSTLAIDEFLGLSSESSQLVFLAQILKQP